jgi:hypothetical protein
MSISGAATEHACVICGGSEFVSCPFGLLRCADCGLVVNPALFRRGAGQALNEEAFGEEWGPETRAGLCGFGGR